MKIGDVLTALAAMFLLAEIVFWLMQGGLYNMTCTTDWPGQLDKAIDSARAFDGAFTTRDLCASRGEVLYATAMVKGFPNTTLSLWCGDINEDYLQVGNGSLQFTRDSVAKVRVECARGRGFNCSAELLELRCRGPACASESLQELEMMIVCNAAILIILMANSVLFGKPEEQ